MKIRRILTIGCAAAIAAGALSACGDKKNAEAENQAVATEESDAAAVATVEEGAPVTTNTDASPTAAVRAEFETALAHYKENKDIKTTASGLKYFVEKEGTGAQPTATDVVTVHYTGLLPNGQVFDSSVDRGEPTSFPLNQVIPGWTEGLQLMKEGGITVFYIPSKIAYGETGTPGGPIGPNQDLIFIVQLINVNK